MARTIVVYGLTTIPEIGPGDDLARVIVEAAEREGVGIESGDVIVVSSKVVSKAEGRFVKLRDVKPSGEALRLAAGLGKDPRLVEVVLRESRRVVKAERGHLIVETRHGFVCANAGVDKSNVRGVGDVVLLLPVDPDESARRIREGIERLTGERVAVVITDTHGRPLREGQVDVAVGLSGLPAFRDYRGLRDLAGYTLRVKRTALADEVAAAADLVKGGGAEAIPVAIVRGLDYRESEESAGELAMPEEKWLFR